MFHQDKNIVAVSIGEQLLHAAYFKYTSGTLKAAALGRESLDGVGPGLWADKLTAVLSSMGVRKARSCCVIPSNIVTTKNIEIPSLDKEEIRSIIDLQAGRHTPYSREEILIGYISIGVFQRNYTKVLLVIANRDAIKSRLAVCEQAGLRVEKILFAPECCAAFYTRLLNEASEEPPIGIIDLGHAATDFLIGHNNTVVTCRSIPLGMRDLLAGGSPQAARLVDEIGQSLEIYHNEDINSLPKKYVLTADSPTARDLQPALREKLNADVEIQPFYQRVPPDEAGMIGQIFARDDSFAALASAAVFLNDPQLQVDLMPEEVRNQRSIEEQGRQVILSGLVAMILLMLVCGMFFTRIYFRNIYLDKIKQQYVLNQYVVVQLDKIAHRTRIIKDYMSGRLVTLDVLEELYRLIPEEMYLQNIFLDENGQINIQGISESMSTVFDVVKALEDSSLFKNVKTRSTTAKKDRGKDAAAFDIVFRLESAPDGPLGEEETGEETE